MTETTPSPIPPSSAAPPPIAGAGRARRVRRVVWIALAGTAVAVVLGFAGALWQADHRILEEPPIAASAGPSVLVLGAGGDVVASRGGFVGRMLLPDELPQRVVDAVVAIEDRRFFDHHGIDFRGVVRAASANLSAGTIREGGSTITQQLAKLEYAGSERTLARKLEEVFIALALERRFTKREILARYLNRVYLGAGVFGIDAGARRYFSVPPDQLTTAQAAMLAGLIRSPSATAPTVHPEAAEARAAQVLDAMVETGALTPEDAATARLRPAKVVAGADVPPSINYFADWVAEQSLKVAGPDAARGVVAQSTVDPTLQRLAESAIERTLARHATAANVSQAAMIVMAPDGAVRAMVGGRDYRASQFNRAAQARRQPGSAFKALVYAAALEAGVSPDAPLIDGPISIGGWAPDNYDGRYLGTVSMETAFAQSLNSVAVQLGQQVGPERLLGLAQRLGIMSKLEPNLSVALGTSEVTLLELMAAYGTIANGGRRVLPYGLVHVQTEDRLVHPVGPVRLDVLIEPAVDDELLRMMVAVVERGTGKAAKLDRPAAGKTGTSQDYRDAWFIGFTRDLVVGVWLGNDDNSGTNRVTGGSLPTQIWRDFMVMAYATGRFGPPNQARPIVGPRVPGGLPGQVAYQPGAPAPVARPGNQPNVFDELGRGLGRVADGILSIFR